MLIKIDVEARLPYKRAIGVEARLVRLRLVEPISCRYAEATLVDSDRVDFKIRFSAATPKAVDDILGALSEFGTPEQRMAKEVVDLISRVASEANTEAGMPSSSVDVMMALNAATGHGNSIWHNCVRQKLSEFFDSV